MDIPLSAGRWAALLILLYTVLYLAPLGVRPLTFPDEVRYAEIAREMTQSRNWVSPRFNGVRYFEKPILGHWINAASMKVFGENGLSARLPSALATGLTALLLFLLVSGFADRASAFLASGIYLTMFEILVVGTTAVLDSLLTLFITAAFIGYFYADRTPPGSRRTWFLALSGAACGGALLVKGFIGLAIPALAIGAYLLAEGRWREMLKLSWLPAISAALIALPWSVLIHVREPDFWHYFFWVEHVNRFAGANAQHARPFWFYLVFLPVIAFPWLFAFPAALAGLRQAAPSRHLQRYLVSWALLPLILLSLSRGKLLTYVLPCLAPLAALIAIGVNHRASEVSAGWLRHTAGLLALPLLCGLAVLVLSQTGLLGQPVYSSGELWRFSTLAASLAAGLLCAGIAWRTRSVRLQLSAFALAALPPYLLVTVALPESLIDAHAPEQFLSRQLGEVASDAVLISDGSLAGSLSWYSGRHDVYMLSKGEMGYGLSYPESQHRVLSETRLLRTIDRNLDLHPIIIFCGPETEQRVKRLFPAGSRRSQSGDMILWTLSGNPHE